MASIPIPSIISNLCMSVLKNKNPIPKIDPKTNMAKMKKRILDFIIYSSVLIPYFSSLLYNAWRVNPNAIATLE